MTDPRIPQDLNGYQPKLGQEPTEASTRSKTPTPTQTGAKTRHGQTVDPLGWCVIATTALLTWLIGPLALAVLASIGFAKYWRAWRSGQTDSKCLLGDIRIVLIYLAALGLVGVAAFVLTTW